VDAIKNMARFLREPHVFLTLLAKNPDCSGASNDF